MNSRKQRRAEQKRVEKERKKTLPQAQNAARINLWKRLTASKLGKKALAYGVAAATLIGSAELAKRHIPYFTRADSHLLKLSFINHDHPLGATAVLREISAAKAEGKPYHVLFVEDYALENKNLASKVKIMNEDVLAMRAEYNALISSGRFNSDQAKQFLEQKYSLPGRRGMQAKLVITSAIEGMKIVPIESYRPEISSKIKELDSQIHQITTELRTLLNSGASLAKLKQKNLELGQKNVQSAQIREPIIKKELMQKIKFVKATFSDLKGAKKLRFIGFFGMYHRNGFYDFQHNKIDYLEIPAEHSVFVGDYSGRLLGRKGRYDGQNAQLETLALFVDGGIRDLLNGNAQWSIPKRPDLARKVFEKAVRLKPWEFLELSELTENVPANERESFIMNYMLK